MTTDTPSGEAAMRLAKAIFETFPEIQRGTDYDVRKGRLSDLAKFIERHYPSPDIAGMRKALEGLLAFAVSPNEFTLFGLIDENCDAVKFAREALASNERKP